MRRISILGATGSVGRSTADVVAQNADVFDVICLVGGKDALGLARMAIALGAKRAVLADEAALPALREALAGSGIACAAGQAAVLEAAQEDCDVTVAAIAGTAGLASSWQALRPGRSLALANKESLVCAGDLFMHEASRQGVAIIPLDSEHNALFQALAGQPLEWVERMTLTASGGPFLRWDAARIEKATPEQALNHPNWSMGNKITIDSAGLVNKGLELIEAMHLFAMPPDKLDVLIHPQSAVHGLVSFIDGSITAGLAAPDMRVPIAHGLGLPGRLQMASRRLDLAALGSLTFERPDFDRFAGLKWAMDAMRAGGSAPLIYNAANEAAVSAFLNGNMPFGAIARVIGETLARYVQGKAPTTVEEALAVDHDVKKLAGSLLPDVIKAAT